MRTRVLMRQGEVAIDYRLGAQGDRWLIYDVIVDGVSIAANYRAQFDGFLTKASYGDLVRQMRARAS